MIAQIQTGGSAPTATQTGAAKAPAAAKGFAALMRGQENPVATPKPAPTDASAPVAASDGAGQDGADATVAEGAEALMALMDKTIATLHQSAEQVTPKRVLARFAEALGAAVPEQLGDLPAVAELADPELVAALQNKIDGALRLTAGVGQLSVASAGVPSVDRGSAAPASFGDAAKPARVDSPRAANTPAAQAAVTPIASAAPSFSAGPAAATVAGEAAPISATPAANAPSGSPAALPTAQAGLSADRTATTPAPTGGKGAPAQPAPMNSGAPGEFSAMQAGPGQGADVAAKPAQSPTVAPVSTPANATGAPTGLPPLTTFAETAPLTTGIAAPTVPAQVSLRNLPSDRPAPALESGKATATSPLALGAEVAAQGGDPRTRVADQFAPGAKIAEFAAQLPTGADALSREAAQLAAPQPAPTGEALRLAPPNPVPAPPPNPAAPPEEQLRQHVAQQIRGLETADNKLRFALSPYGMGEIEIEVVRLESGRMQIAMTTESAAVLNMLRQDREQLLEALQSRGLDADSADLDFQTFDDRGRGSGGDRFAPDLARAEGGASPEDPAQDSAPAPRMTSGSGQLDILT